MGQKTEGSGMDYKWLKRVGTISCWVVVVPLIYFLAAPLLLLLFSLLPEAVSQADATQEVVFTLLTPGIFLYESGEFYETYCDWVLGI